MNLLLSENMPLRTTKVFGTFAEEAVLPHHYGDLSDSPVPLVKLSDTKFLVADHPVVSVVGVQIDGSPAPGYVASVGTDPTGHAYALVTLSTPLPPGAVITATIKGKFNPKTGGLMSSPADIVEDIFGLAGRSDTVPQLRIETAALSIAGSITKVESIRHTVDTVMRSIGAIWTLGMARVYPRPVVPHAGMVELSPSNSGAPTFTAAVSSFSGSLLVKYAHNEAKNEFSQSITLRATPNPFGLVKDDSAPPEVEAGWIRQAVDAEALGRRLLSRLASDKVTVSVDTSETSIRPGDWVRLNYGFLPVSGVQYMMVTGVAITPFKRTASLTGEVIYGSTPTIVITQVSKAAPTPVSGGVGVAYANGIATFTVLDPDGKPIFGAYVVLDKGVARKTNSKGEVSFEAKPGKHTLGIQADGYTPFEMTVTI